jgi:O-antigen/teichoic acid export membrane protein
LRKTIGTWRERVTGPTARQGVGALADQAVASLTNFLTTVIVGRACTQAQLGYYSLGASLVLVVLAVQRSLIVTPYMVSAAHLRGRPLERYTGSSLAHNMGLTAAAMLIIFVISVMIGRSPAGEDLSAVLRLLSVAVACITMRRLARLLCYARLKLGVALVMDVSVFILQVGGLGVLWHLGLVSAETAYWVVGMATGAVSVAWLVATRRAAKISPRHVRVHWRRNWIFSRWLLLGFTTFAVSLHVYPWLLTAFHGADAAGVLQACLSIVYLSNPFVYGLSNLLPAKCAHALASGGVGALRRTVLYGTVGIGGGMLVLACVIVIAGNHLLILLFGPEYSGNTRTLVVLAVTQLAAALTAGPTGGLLALKRSDLMLASHLTALAIAIGAGPWLAWALGPTGAALGLLACYTGILLVRTVLFHRVAAATATEA